MSFAILRMVDPEMSPYEFAKRAAGAFSCGPRRCSKRGSIIHCSRTWCSTIFSLVTKADGTVTCPSFDNTSRGLEKALNRA